MEAPADHAVVATVRTASWPEAARGGSASVEAASVDAALPAHTRFVGLAAGKSDRPDLQSAKRVVSGGRGVGSQENNIPNTVEQQMEALNKMGGLDAIGTHKTDNMYHAGWAWAGNTPLKSTKLVAAHFGGTRSPMAISWPAGAVSAERSAFGSTSTRCRGATKALRSPRLYEKSRG